MESPNSQDNMNEETFYAAEKTPKLKERLAEVDGLKDRINALRDQCPEVWRSVREALRIEWTADSNAIEGSTLSHEDTYFLLREGLTVHGKPFKDFVEAANHAEAIDYLYQIAKDERPLSERVIKDFNALLLEKIRYTEAVNQFGEKVKKPAHPGQYKKQPNHVIQPDGSIHYYAEPLQVAGEMERLCAWINEASKLSHPVIVGSTAHYNLVRIHPFDDGNGRVARLLMNLIFIKKGYPPAVIKNEQRPEYIKALREADQGGIETFTEFIADSLFATQKSVLEKMEKGNGHYEKYK